MGAGDRERWNTKHGKRPAAAAPSSFLPSLDALLPRTGRALDAGGGTGRHALWLARRGFDVTLADVSDVALSQAAQVAHAEGLRLSTLQTDLDSAPFPAGPWALVLFSYFLHRPLIQAAAAALAPGGWLVVVHPTRKNLERHDKPGLDHLLEEGELARLAAGLEIVSYQEAWADSDRHEARLAARK